MISFNPQLKYGYDCELWFDPKYLFPNELWVDVIGYEKHYKISSYGRVKSLERRNKNIRGPRIIKEKILSLYHDQDGYFQVKLCRNGIAPTKRVHRLVALHFCLRRSPSLVPNHIDGIKINNSISNLEWVTISENTKHAYKLGLAKSPSTPSGFKNSKSKPIKIENGSRKIYFGGLREAARSLGTNHTRIRYCIENNKLFNNYIVTTVSREEYLQSV